MCSNLYLIWLTLTNVLILSWCSYVCGVSTNKTLGVFSSIYNQTTVENRSTRTTIVTDITVTSAIQNEIKDVKSDSSNSKTHRTTSGKLLTKHHETGPITTTVDEPVLPAPSFAFQTAAETEAQERDEAEERKFIIGICAGIGFCIGFVILCCCLWKICCSDSSDDKDVKIVNNRLKDIKSSRNVTSQIHEETELPDYSARRPKMTHRRPLPVQPQSMEMTHNGSIPCDNYNGIKRKRTVNRPNENANDDSNINDIANTSRQRVPRRESSPDAASNNAIDTEVFQRDPNRRSRRSKRAKAGIKNPAFQTDQEGIQQENSGVHQLSADYDPDLHHNHRAVRDQIDSCTADMDSQTAVRSHRRNLSNMSNQSQRRILQEDSDEGTTAYEFYLKNRNARPKKIFQS